MGLQEKIVTTKKETQDRNNDIEEKTKIITKDNKQILDLTDKVVTRGITLSRKDKDLKEKDKSLENVNKDLNDEKQKAKIEQEGNQEKIKELQGKIDANEKERENDCIKANPANEEKCCPCIGGTNKSGKNSWC